MKIVSFRKVFIANRVITTDEYRSNVTFVDAAAL